MYDSSFSARSLQYVYKESDLEVFQIKNFEEAQQRIALAETYLQSIESDLKVKVAHNRNRKLFLPENYESTIILRKLDSNVNFFSRAKRFSRNDIIIKLKEILSDGVPYNIGRYDIRRFYESINIENLLSTIDRKMPFLYETRRYLKRFLLQHLKSHGPGLPTGLSLSATLAEVYMEDFDDEIRSLPWVHFFARYVDDIIIITNPNVTKARLEKALIDALHPGLSLNNGVDKRYFEPLPIKETPKEWQAEFDYLGYNFRVGAIKSNTKIDKNLQSRLVIVDISDKKIKLRKSRFIKVVRQYLADGDYDKLVKRFRLLNSGYVFFDMKRSVFRKAGIIHSYQHIDLPSDGLKSLEKMYRSIFLGRKGSICARLRLSPISRAQRKYFISHSIDKNFLNSAHVHIDPKEIAELVECWKHV